MLEKKKRTYGIFIVIRGIFVDPSVPIFFQVTENIISKQTFIGEHLSLLHTLLFLLSILS